MYSFHIVGKNWVKADRIADYINPLLCKMERGDITDDDKYAARCSKHGKVKKIYLQSFCWKRSVDKLFGWGVFTETFLSDFTDKSNFAQ